MLNQVNLKNTKNTVELLITRSSHNFWNKFFSTKNNEELAYLKERHPFHIVASSPWPFCMALSLFSILVLSVHKMSTKGYVPVADCFAPVVFMLLFVLYHWFMDIKEESIMGYHTPEVQRGFRYGMVLFIISEVMFFFGIFWAYLHFSLSPGPGTGGIWPPAGITPLNWMGLPALNTALLLCSGFFGSWALKFVQNGNRSVSTLLLLISILLGFIFLMVQGYEYISIPFSFKNGGIYASVFFISTGFHGLHVFIGLLFLLASLFFIKTYSTRQHLCLEFALWYWHFVDIVWICLYIIVYIWGS